MQTHPAQHRSSSRIPLRYEKLEANWPNRPISTAKPKCDSFRGRRSFVKESFLGLTALLAPLVSGCSTLPTDPDASFLQRVSPHTLISNPLTTGYNTYTILNERVGVDAPYNPFDWVMKKIVYQPFLIAASIGVTAISIPVEIVNKGEELISGKRTTQEPVLFPQSAETMLEERKKKYDEVIASRDAMGFPAPGRPNNDAPIGIMEIVSPDKTLIKPFEAVSNAYWLIEDGIDGLHPERYRGWKGAIHSTLAPAVNGVISVVVVGGLETYPGLVEPLTDVFELTFGFFSDTSTYRPTLFPYTMSEFRQIQLDDRYRETHPEKPKQ